ncbi:hypothetical protein [Flavobacterium sp. LHD-85]|uniref:hypothetical protein n=1 Tax=Flavobacterium sp. LHD-85 TaxID=3071410 RepID=UPI0027E1BC51|nr:hypothetical protein [Flavobacterium sp. LHD-85]MDQ6527683.1 hypothetical protein [Flavobacterium sp. LHD-85]
MKLRFTYVLLIFIIIICSSTIPNYRYSKKAYNQEENTILWSNDRKLTWEDFKGVPDSSSQSVLVTVAGTTSVINFEYKTIKNMMTSYKIESIFVKNKSWTITSDTLVLAHEQLHFDITELYARRIRKTFDSLKSRKNYIEDNYVKVYDHNIMQKNELDDLYDNQVYGNNMNQNRWIKKISNEILKLKKYEYLPED